MLHSIILSLGGIPLIYLGDEAGTLSDYGYANDPAKAGDSRWVHRPAADWARLERRGDPTTLEGQIFAGLARLIELRKGQPALWDGQAEFVECGNPHLFGYIRHHGGQRLLIVANFSERAQELDANRLRMYGPGYRFTDLISGQARTSEGPLALGPYEYVWLEAAAES